MLGDVDLKDQYQVVNVYVSVCPERIKVSNIMIDDVDLKE